MKSQHFGGSSATGSAPLGVSSQPSGSAVFSSDAIDAHRRSLHNAIVRAWHRRDNARTDAEYSDADADLAHLSKKLADLAAAPVGRVPSEEA
jgi:hypothetical protein